MVYPIRVLAQYSLGSIAGAKRIRRGYVSRIWEVTTSTGRYVLRRRHPDCCNPQFVRAQHTLMRRLRRSGFPAPALVRTRSGESLVSVGDLCYEVQTYIPGSPCDDLHPVHRAEAARMLGRYHRVVAGFDAPALHRIPARYHPGTLRSIAAQLIGDPSQACSDGSDIGDRLTTHVGEIQARLADFELLPALVIHGDYYAQNLIMRGDEIVGVLDYDQVHWAPRVVEVAEALIYFAREGLAWAGGAPRFKHIVYPGWVDLDLTSQFIAAYREMADLTLYEISAFPDVMRLIWLSASLSPPLRPRLRMGQDAEAISEALNLADWAREKADAISSALGSRNYG